MGLLVDGAWVDRWYDTESTGGRFEREAAGFRDWVTATGELVGGGHGFEAEPGRYHLYVSHACPWSHRTMIYRQIKGLEQLVPVSVTHWLMAEHGWTFAPGEGVIADPNLGANRLYQLYQAADPGFTGHCTVPMLWDKHRNTIVSNESADIIRMFNSAFDHLGAAAGDYYPADLSAVIDAMNERIYTTLNNGVYRAGFATSQHAYEEAVRPLFETLDWLDQHLQHQRYLAGDRVTEADWRLFPTLLRFDPVYSLHFKCSRRRIGDYPHLGPYLRDLYQHPGVAETVHLDHIKLHYYCSHKQINPSGIVPLSPDFDLNRDPHRQRLAA
jgi:glutathionyl-hydroquinone reductase